MNVLMWASVQTPQRPNATCVKVINRVPGGCRGKGLLWARLLTHGWRRHIIRGTTDIQQLPVQVPVRENREGGEKPPR